MPAVRRHPGALPLALLALAALAALFASRSGLGALFAPASAYDTERMLFLFSALPRLATALLSGAALALAGTLLQQALRNPLASETTLGISAGGHLALALALLYAPALIGFSRDLVALAGSAAAAGLVFLFTRRRGFSPTALILCGLVVTLYCGALSTMLVLLNDRYLVSLFIWGAGSLDQQSWRVPLDLLVRLPVLGLLAALLLRSLALLDVEEAGAASLGLSVARTRFLAVALAVVLAASVTSAVGVIGFVGLVAPALARLGGARRLKDRLIFAPLVGAGLLALTDALVQVAEGSTGLLIPTGAVTALFGSPLLLFLLPRLKGAMRPPEAAMGFAVAARATPASALALFGLALAAIAFASLLVGRAPGGGFAIASGADLALLLPWRWPPLVGAASAGAMLAVAGAILQRLTGNEMASPEVLGVSAGATLGVAVALFALAGPSASTQLLFAVCGAAAVLGLMLVLARRSPLAPDRILLSGIALGALLDALVGVLTSAGDPRAVQLLRWMSGQTYDLAGADAVRSLLLLLVLGAAALLSGRWLTLLPLGPEAAAARGLRVARSRTLLVVLAAALSATATLVVGPLSFVGLMAPHIARHAGLRGARAELLGAALAGAAIMAAADWAARIIAFPYLLPAGLTAAIVGAPAVLFLLRRARTAA